MFTYELVGVHFFFLRAMRRGNIEDTRFLYSLAIVMVACRSCLVTLLARYLCFMITILDTPTFDEQLPAASRNKQHHHHQQEEQQQQQQNTQQTEHRV